MNPWKVSAQFAAFVWYSEHEPEKPKHDAARFAKKNWIAFLPCAHKGIGLLLAKIAGPEEEMRTQEPRTVTENRFRRKPLRQRPLACAAR